MGVGNLDSEIWGWRTMLSESEWTESELEDQLRALDLSTNGEKQEMIYRISNHLLFLQKSQIKDDEFSRFQRLLEGFEERSICKAVSENGEPCESKSCYVSIYGWTTTKYCPEHLDQASLLSRLRFSSIIVIYLALYISGALVLGSHGLEPSNQTYQPTNQDWIVYCTYLFGLLWFFHYVGLISRSPEDYEKQVLELYEQTKQEVEDFRERMRAQKKLEKMGDEVWKAKIEQRLEKNKELWAGREAKLRSIAKHVFSNIDEFRIDLYDGTLSFSVGGRSLRYNDVLTRSNKSIEEEMKEDKNRRPTPRCSARNCSRPARSGYGGFCPSHYDTYHGGA